MENRFIILILFLLVFVDVNSQIVLDRLPQGELLYVYEKNDGKILLLDSIPLLNIFSEYSYCENDQLIYLVWSASSSEGKVYYINTYTIGYEKEIELKGQYWIEETKHKKLFEKGLRISVNDKGLQLNFTQGKFSQMVFAFDGLELKEISKELSKIAEF